MNIENKKTRPFLLIELLESFSESELEGLKYFVTCKHFNTDKYVIKLLSVLKKKIIGKQTLNADNQYIVYGEVFSDLPSGKKVLTKTQKATFNAKMNALLRLAERFLTVEALEKDEVYRSDLLFRELLQKKQFKLFNRHLKRGEKKMPKESKDGNVYLYLYKMETNRLYYLSVNGKLKQEDNLSTLNQNLDIYYLLNKLHLKTTALSLEDSYQKSYEFLDTKNIDLLLDLPQYATHPLLQIHRKIVDLLSNKTPSAFTDLINSLDQNMSSIPKDDLRASYVVVGNFCMSQIRKGYMDYHHHLFRLYKTMDAKKIILLSGVMPVLKLANMITLSSRIGEFEWAKKMSHKYTPFIIKTINKDDVYDYNLGVIAFYQKDYETAVDYLYKVDNIHPNCDLSCRVIVVKSYYEIETEYNEATAQMFRSIEKYVSEHKLLHVNRKKAYKTFIRLLINLYRVRHHEGKMTLESIKNKLEKAEFISDKNWLLEKIQELEKKRR